MRCTARGMTTLLNPTPTVCGMTTLLGPSPTGRGVGRGFGQSTASNLAQAAKSTRFDDTLERKQQPKTPTPVT